MAKYVALLRGINVGGHRKIRMADLKALFERLGYSEIKTYLQSGNVVFSDSKKRVDRARVIEGGIEEAFGHDVSVLILAATVFLKLADSNPLSTKSGVNSSFLHVTFLYGSVSAAIVKDAIPLKGDEAAVLHSGHYCLYCPNGYGRTKINNSYFERALKVSATTRNWKTVQALKGMLEE